MIIRMKQSFNHLGPNIRVRRDLPCRRGKLPKLMVDEMLLVRPMDGAANAFWKYDVYDPKNPCVLLGSSHSYTDAEHMAIGLIPLCDKFDVSKARRA